MSVGEIPFIELTENLKKIFRDSDPSSTGTIEQTRLSEVLRECEPSLSDEELQVLFEHADKNGDGAIQYEEFIDLIFDLGGDTSDMPKPSAAALESEEVGEIAMAYEPMEMGEMCCMMPEPVEPFPLKHDLELMRSERIREERSEILQTSTNRKQVLEILKEDNLWHRFEDLNEELRVDRDFAVSVVSVYGENVRYLPDEWKLNRTVAKAAVRQSGYAMRYLPEVFQEDYELSMAAVTKHGGALECLTHVAQSNKEIVLAAVKQEPYAIADASEELKDDREVALIIALSTPDALKHMSTRLKCDREVILAALSTNWDGVLELLSDCESDLNMDPEIVQLALMSNRRGGLQHVASLEKWDAKNLNVYRCVHPDGCWLQDKTYEKTYDDDEMHWTKAMMKKGPTHKVVAVCEDDIPIGDPDIQFNEEVKICAEVVPREREGTAQGLFLAIPREKRFDEDEDAMCPVFRRRQEYKPGGWAREFSEDGTRILEKVHSAVLTLSVKQSSNDSSSISCTNISGSEVTTAKSGTTLGELRSRLADCLGMHMSNFTLLTVRGEILSASDDEKALAELVL